MDVIYRIDSNDLLVYVDGAFQRFADSTGVPDLPSHWLGQSVWGCFGDDELRAVYVALVARARAGRALSITTRCDSPGGHRTAAIELAPWTDGGVEFRCTLGPPTAPTDRDASPCCELLRVCAWCHRADCGAGWSDIESVVDQTRLLERTHLPTVTHGICDACMADTAAKLESLATA